ncbi:MAG: DUF349 domain-containing protein [Rikenellaceae bacterium]
MERELEIPSAQNELLSKAEDVQTNVEKQEVDASSSTSVDVQDDTVTPLEPEQPESEPQEAQSDSLEGDETESSEDAEQASAAGELFVGKSKAEVVEFMARLLQNEPIQTLRQTVEAVKVAFYKYHRSEVEALHRAFVEQGGDAESFVVPTDELERKLKELFREYRVRRDEYIAGIESQKEMNLKIKLQVIEELKVLNESDETLEHTFVKFRELQHRWRDTGGVPVANVKDLWETYNYHTEIFYDLIKINKELRDLDLKKNLELKSALCEKAEALKSQPSIVEAFRKLQTLHEEWRETGPVASDYKESIWARFKEASSIINKLHQEYFIQLKDEQVANLERKEALCQSVESLLERKLTSHKEWNKANEDLLSMQKSWKGIGFAPKKDNNRIYDRFRTACDKFFDAKRLFYSNQKDEMEQNTQRKVAICERAEALSSSEDWKAATDELIALQTEWKGIGTVSQRVSDQLWRRFRGACDSFFERKSTHFSSQDNEQDTNLKAKEALLEEMSSVDILEAGGFDAIKAYQRRWSEIGFVPFKQKDALQKRYKEVVDKLFNSLRSVERDRSMSRFKDKISTMKSSGDRRVKGEREKLYNKVKQLEADIALLENNIGFFSKSKGAEAMIAEVNRKIERARAEMQDTINKVKLIDAEASKEVK